MNTYDGIYVYNEDDLDTDFYNHFKDKFCLRGFGYWVWKPQIILQTLSKLNDGDLLQYTDIGCHLNLRGKKRLYEYFEMADTSETGLLAFDIPWYTEKQWTKGDLFDYFNVRNREDIFPEQIAATLLFIKKCPQSVAIIHKWLKVFYDDFSLVDDSPSKSKNFIEFRENRHDQSVWSILVKLHKVPCISHMEQWAQDFRELKEFPILAKRDKLFKRKALLTIIMRVLRRLLRLILYARKLTKG
ncbi:MAG: hypothetical protein LBD20_00660 [Spirochaetaceae bacterium]|jgi:hypothetical protein|nr:hypothetical protein [Spirochaetaceae bacterium]